MNNFSISGIPELFYGPGSIQKLPVILGDSGYSSVAVITGGKSFAESEKWNSLYSGLKGCGLTVRHFKSEGETDPYTVDSIVAEIRSMGDVDAVAAIGGGTALDTGKAVSAMLCMTGSVTDYLEGIGSMLPTGKRKPLVCVPTTSGTGSEATKNAVITKTGISGFKKSLRHKNYVPDTAILDPDLVLECPYSISMFSGLDAVTQLLEAYVSSRACMFTDLLALEGLRLAGKALPALADDLYNMQARADMAYAAYLSGIALANADLGVVHGAASVLGAMRPIPHGAVCGTLLGAATSVIIGKLKERLEFHERPLEKYAEASEALIGPRGSNVADACSRLEDKLNGWTEEFKVPVLSQYGFTREEVIEASGITGLKNTPFPLSREDIKNILDMRL